MQDTRLGKSDGGLGKGETGQDSVFDDPIDVLFYRLSSLLFTIDCPGGRHWYESTTIDYHNEHALPVASSTDIMTIVTKQLRHGLAQGGANRALETRFVLLAFH